MIGQDLIVQPRQAKVVVCKDLQGPPAVMMIPVSPPLNLARPAPTHDGRVLPPQRASKYLTLAFEKDGASFGANYLRDTSWHLSAEL